MQHASLSEVLTLLITACGVGIYAFLLWAVWAAPWGIWWLHACLLVAFLGAGLLDTLMTHGDLDRVLVETWRVPGFRALLVLGGMGRCVWLLRHPRE